MFVSPSQALCQDARQRNDVYQLAVNLFDRYLSRQALVSETELQALTAACAMVSLKIRRARRECLSYYQLLYHFHGVSEKSIMVSCCQLAVMVKVIRVLKQICTNKVSWVFCCLKHNVNLHILFTAYLTTRLCPSVCIL